LISCAARGAGRWTPSGEQAAAAAVEVCALRDHKQGKIDAEVQQIKLQTSLVPSRATAGLIGANFAVVMVFCWEEHDMIVWRVSAEGIGADGSSARYLD